MSTGFSTLGRVVRRWRINRLCERCAGLKAKIEYWDGLRAVNRGGLPPSLCERIGEWRERMAELVTRKTRLEGAEIGRSCTPASTPSASSGSPFRFKDQDEFMSHYCRDGGDARGCALPIVSATWKAARETVPSSGPGQKDGA